MIGRVARTLLIVLVLVVLLVLLAAAARKHAVSTHRKAGSSTLLGCMRSSESYLTFVYYNIYKTTTKK